MINGRGDHKSVSHNFTGADDFINLNNGYHFDARLVAEYFKDIATERGVYYYDGIVKDVTITDGVVNHIIMDTEDKVYCDLVFDCSGFSRFIVGKKLQEEWVSYEKYLKVNSAIAYFLPQEEKFTARKKTYTNMISMKSGWMWQAPLQHRWGCGYVFDDNYISEDEAKNEVQDYLGHDIEIVKSFKFNSGYYKRSWVSNCISIGLAYTFLEPLESTSLMSIIMQLRKLVNLDFDGNKKDHYNKFCEEVNMQNMVFVRYHYMCERDDTEFWRNCKNASIPEALSRIVNEDGSLKISSNEELYKALGLKECKINSLSFYYPNYYTIFKKNSKIFQKDII